MKRNNHNQTHYPYKRSVHSSLYYQSRPPQPIYRRPVPSHSYYPSRPIQPIYRRSVPSSSYYHSRPPQPIYRRSASRGNKKKKIFLSAGFLLITVIGAFGLINILNSTSNVGNSNITINITSPSQGSIISSGTISISWVCSTSQYDIDYFEIQINYGTWTNLGSSTSHTFSGLTSGAHNVVVRAWDNQGNSETESISFTIDIPQGKKIAVFFWASDAGTTGVINEYIDVLSDEGYTKFFNFRNTNNFESDFQEVEDFEGSNDIVFFYIIGHGYNNGQHSYTSFAPSSSVVSSNQFRQKCDALDSSQVGLLIESCKSGDWSDDMKGGGYLAMSTSDENHNSYAVGSIPGEGLFSNTFFNEIVSGSNAIDAFSAAKSISSSQYPKLCDESAYDFFAD